MADHIKHGCAGTVWNFAPSKCFKQSSHSSAQVHNNQGVGVARLSRCHRNGGR